MFDDPRIEGHLPRPFGVFYQIFRPTYDDIMSLPVGRRWLAKRGPGDLDKLLAGRETWTIKA